MSSYLAGLRPMTLEKAQQESQATLELADRPQQALTGLLVEGVEGAKKGFLGQEKYDGLDAIVEAHEGQVPDDFLYGAASLAYDVLADPTNLIGGALLKGFDLLEIGANKGRGMLTGSSPNVISDFYGLDPNKAFPTGYNPEKVQKALEAGEEVPSQAKKAYGVWATTKLIADKMGTSFDALPKKYQKKILQLANKLPASATNNIVKLKGNLDNPSVKKQADEVLGAVFKGAGFANWAGKSAANVFSTLFDASARQAYKDTGLTPVNQKRVEKLFNQGTKAGVQSAVAQLQHAAYMAYRRGRKDLPPVLQETMDQMSIGGFQKLDPTKYNELSTTVEKTVRGESYKTPAPVVESLFKRAIKNWGVGMSDDATMVVRQPQGVSGNFVYDANIKSKVAHAGRRIFADNPEGFSSVVDLKKAFEARGFNPKNIQMTPDGIMITHSAASSSRLEGGINLVTHIDKGGIGNTVLSDVYDFLEKVPVVRKVEEMMDEDIIGITPPITLDFTKGASPVSTNRTTTEDVGKLVEMNQGAKLSQNAKSAANEKQAMTGMFGGGLVAREMNDDEE